MILNDLRVEQIFDLEWYPNQCFGHNFPDRPDFGPSSILVPDLNQSSLLLKFCLYRTFWSSFTSTRCCTGECVVLAKAEMVVLFGGKAESIHLTLSTRQCQVDSVHCNLFLFGENWRNTCWHVFYDNVHPWLWNWENWICIQVIEPFSWTTLTQISNM